ncbi:alpha-glucan family phosphorylase [Flaviaesturariibacter flavus]|uniref:Alpha-glucan family phosphorylase n=1 Tax=Flaviaesturariibacter flavus TaxID=2502780 RepID=A0A4R1BP30_9BACT|nr:alpha-glucan family phosphorylase [Flaviaesturariibacter flavus]TCJ19086.1 alpha-glucan family phosphorylase [Flaviaesturariibacter flavus]
MNENSEELIRLLRSLAMDLHWSWNHATDKLWHQLDPELWEATHNPLVVLQTVSSQRIEGLLEDPIAVALIRELSETQRQQALAPAWFQHEYAGTEPLSVAYFSMEYMLSEALPIYSGGLGNVSGDLLKTASDLGVPLVGVGLLYQQGYSRQVLEADGTQHYLAPFNDPGQLPVTPLRTGDGEWLRVELALPGASLWLRTWRVQVGRTELLLLDSNDPANLPVYRGLSSRLYDDDPGRRLAQQMILGIGGWRLLQALGKTPQVCHLNEGHSAFVVLERAADFMQRHGCSFAAAWTATRGGNVFTTHTATGAGFDRFPRALLEKYFSGYCAERPGISFTELLALGQASDGSTGDTFSTAWLALRGSAQVNGVSRLHAAVSRSLFAPLFPRWPLDEIPIGHVTNGVHMPTWDSPEADRLWTEACGKDRWKYGLEKVSKDIQQLPDERLWSFRNEKSRRFCQELNDSYGRQLAIRGAEAQGPPPFDPALPTLGFARRFAGYKRPGLLLTDPGRLRRLLLHPGRPVQLVLAGKSHPSDAAAQEVIRAWISFINGQGVQHRAVFLGDYDMRITGMLVQGVDLWINTPRRPWEACGTSGMKVLVNGGLHLSELDGWWDEAYREDCGWTFGDRLDFASDEEHDRHDAQRLYDLLENEIIPLFYQRDAQNLPTGWIGKMRNSMALLTPTYSSVRALQEYVRGYYQPAAERFRHRSAEAARVADEIAREMAGMQRRWPGLRFGELRVIAASGALTFIVEVFLNGIPPRELHVELYADRGAACEALQQPMLPDPEAPCADGYYCYRCTVAEDRPAANFTPRLRPVYSRQVTSLESPLILWHH